VLNLIAAVKAAPENTDLFGWDSLYRCWCAHRGRAPCPADKWTTEWWRSGRRTRSDRGRMAPLDHRRDWL